MNTASADRQSPLGLSFATHLLWDGYDIRARSLQGHKDVKTIMVYTHVLNRGGRGVCGSLDSLRKAASSESSGIIRASRSAVNAREVLENEGSHGKQSGCRPVWRRRLSLRPTRTGFIHVSLNSSYLYKGLVSK